MQLIIWPITFAMAAIDQLSTAVETKPPKREA